MPSSVEMLKKVERYISKLISKSPRTRFEDLPEEIIVMIFLRCLPLDRDWFPQPTNRQFPLLFGLVCKQWRTVAFSCPQLWTKLSISMKTWEKSGKWIHQKVYTQWMKRSGEVPLSLEVTHVVRCSPCSRTSLDTLLRDAGRWKAVRLSFRYRCACVEGILNALHNPQQSPLLEDFCLHFSGPASVIAYCPQSLCYPSKLASLRLVRYPLSPLRQPLPLLRELRINSTQSLGNYFTILDLCPQLEVLEVACKLSPSSGNQPIRIAPRLHTFVFVGSYESAGSSLDYIHLPAIQLLSVTFNTIGWIPSYGAHLVDFLTRCGLDLQELRLSTPHISSEILVQCLQCVPNINTLCLISQMIDEAFVEAFTVPLNDCSGLCPRLEYLEFDTRQRLATSLIASMIASRWRFHGGQRVARPLAVGLFPVIQEVSNRAEVRKCIQAGLKIYEYNSNGKWWALSL